ncbi:MAG TPA: hypothetical protein IGS17_02300 [Oscillatoriales cyanobacterium M59_W2019_021]|nr:MAG: hypothetical protein D6728_11970 [Cyanobacteria bacterium J055]HIK31958.1 hypothetical protein [Oscillatoriales cyanobacterium M4454_W2019_049]HIK49747.1 hypothetical protein [Oscillatoriales cyanobacterium M59_W2019_021]
MIPGKLTFPPDGYHLVAICLNLVHQRGLTVDRAMEEIANIGITPELKYQWNDIYNEIDVIAVISCKPIEQTTEEDERQEDRLWKVFGQECLLSMGSTGQNYPNFLVRWHLEQTIPPPPPKPDRLLSIRERIVPAPIQSK